MSEPLAVLVNNQASFAVEIIKLCRLAGNGLRSSGLLLGGRGDLPGDLVNFPDGGSNTIKGLFNTGRLGYVFFDPDAAMAHGGYRLGRTGNQPVNYLLDILCR